MSYTEEQRDALRRALASGERRVSYDGKTVEYRSVAELKEALAEVEAALTQAEGKRVRQIRINTNKGF
jgi:roadblock/LC7 domain-containing protein